MGKPLFHELRGLGVVAGHWLADRGGQVDHAAFYHASLTLELAASLSIKTLQLMALYQGIMGVQPEMMFFSFSGAKVVARNLGDALLILVCRVPQLPVEMREELNEIVQRVGMGAECQAACRKMVRKQRGPIDPFAGQPVTAREKELLEHWKQY